MSGAHLCVIVAMTTILHSIGTSSGINSDFGLKENVTVNCGGILNETSGTISYKIVLAVAENERCAWILRAENATSYQIDTYFLFPSDSNSTLHLSFTGISYDTNETLEYIVADTNSNSSTYTINSNVVVVAFHSGVPWNDDRYAGFALNFNATQDNGSGQQIPSINSADFVIDTMTPGSVKHPSHNGTYAKGELSLFLFTPANHTYDPSGYLNVSVTVYPIEEGECYDRFWIYYYDHNRATVGLPVWQYMYRMCGRADEFVMRYTPKDKLLVVFQTNFVNEFSGFSISWLMQT